MTSLDGGETVDAAVPDDNPTASGDKVPHIKLRRFFGDERKYPDWKNEILTTKMLYKVPDSKMAGLVY